VALFRLAAASTHGEQVVAQVACPVIDHGVEGESDVAPLAFVK
jgi:hypothetical protein